MNVNPVAVFFVISTSAVGHTDIGLAVSAGLVLIASLKT